MKIRTAKLSDLSAIFEVGTVCFPPEEAATEKEFEERLKVYPDHFWILEENGELIGFINGMVTNEPTIRDEMFKNASLHEGEGAWQAIFGVNTVPKYRKHGYAAKMMEQVIADAKKQGRKGCILTCKKELIHYYEKFGYKNEGISQSSLGDSVWYDMCLEF
ncbi:GNAT family N-acetyltransferase [Lysinibacillus sphaericus]|uniref:Acetyltransferase n=1 Tax=Lysinibacillus sphaericus OT4b.31 TaxID=1285586 RepID=R7Z937_LYSSH|nr:GNAT family N-acetyltransferase [Lysinibacillus sphaericus]EON70680.1 acetyltransferase [Lysinibacillus sphaericus OT4b.31]